MLEQVTFEETKCFTCSVGVLSVTLTWKRHSSVSFDIV